MTGTGFLNRLAAATALVAAAVLPHTRPLDAATLPCEFEGVSRVVAVGDVHGAYDRLVEILRTTGLLDARLRWAGGKTHLVQLGDIVDRGPDSRKAIDFLRKLQDEAKRAGGAVHLLLGNHEAMRMLGDMRYTLPAEYAAFTTDRSAAVRQSFIAQTPAEQRDQLLKDTPLGYIEMRLAFGRQGVYGEWLRTLDVSVKIDGVVFVHGGISPANAGRSCDDLNQASRRELTVDEEKTRTDPTHSLVAGDEGPLWYRGLAQEPETFAPQVDAILAAQHARAIVIGHSVTPDGRIRARFGGRVIAIDTGMQPAYVERGRASALELQNGALTAIYTDRRDTLPAPDAVPAVR
jgi:diadenosine tetraphosphatase ApaH/serine/threonine PP2A family protein phosphatase